MKPGDWVRVVGATDTGATGRVLAIGESPLGRPTVRISAPGESSREYYAHSVEPLDAVSRLGKIGQSALTAVPPARTLRD